MAGKTTGTYANSVRDRDREKGGWTHTHTHTHTHSCHIMTMAQSRCETHTPVNAEINKMWRCKPLLTKKKYTPTHTHKGSITCPFRPSVPASFPFLFVFLIEANCSLSHQGQPLSCCTHTRTHSYITLMHSAIKGVRWARLAWWLTCLY